MARRRSGESRDRPQAAQDGRDEARRQEALYGSGQEPEEAPASAESDPRLAPRPAYRRDADVVQLRVPPHSIEAEQAVIGAVLLWPESFWKVTILLKREDFYRRDHQLVWGIVGTMHERAKDSEETIDAITVGAEVEAMGLQEQVPPSYLIELSMGTGSAANIEGYARIVADRANLRRLIEAGTHIVNSAFNPEGRTAEEVMSSSVARLEIANPRIDADGSPIRDVAGGIFKTMQERLEWDHERLPGVRFGFPSIEEKIGGLEAERTYGVGGRAKMGKSIMLENISTNVAQGEEEGDVLVYTLEMSKAQWVQRMVAHVSGVQYEKISRPKMLNEDDWAKLTLAFKSVRDLPVKVFDSPSTIEEISARAIMHNKRRPVKLVVVDYLQIIQKSEKMDRRDLEIGHSSWGLKELSKRVKAPVVYGFQINRGSEQGALVRPPRPSDARESGNIEQDLDVMMLLHRPGYYDKKSKGCRLDLALNRDGETALIELYDQLDMSRFVDTGKEWHDGQTNEQRKDNRNSDSGF